MNIRESGTGLWQVRLHCARQQAMLSALQRHSTGPVYIVGGFLRDALLGKGPSHDIDLVLALAEESDLYLATARQLGWHGFVLDATRSYVRLLCESDASQPDADPLTVDLAPLARDGIEADLARRDCTANAMALEIRSLADGWATGRWHDPWGGQADLAAGILKPVALDNLRVDPVRMVRIFRLGHTCRLQVDAGMVQFIQGHAGTIGSVHPSRLWQEVWKLLAHTGRPVSSVLQQLDDVGLLTYILPVAAKPGPGCTPHLTPTQFLALMDHIQGLAFQDAHVAPFWWRRYPVAPALQRQLGAALEAPLARGVTRRQWWMYLGCVVGRQLTLVPDTPASPPLPLSGSLADPQSSYMKASGVAKIQRKHSRVVLQGCYALLDQLAQPAFRPGDRRVLHRLIMHGGWTRDVSVFVDIIAVLDAVDQVVPLAAGATGNRFRETCQHILELLAAADLGRPRPLVSASEVQACFGLAPGPEMGCLLDQLLEAQAGQIVSTPEEAKRYIAELQ